MFIIDNVIEQASADLPNKELYRACFNVCEYIKNTKLILLCLPSLLAFDHSSLMIRK